MRPEVFLAGMRSQRDKGGGYSNQTDTAVSAVYVHTATRFCFISSICTYSSQILLYQQYMYIQQPNRYCCMSSICTYSNQILLYQQYLYIQQPDSAVSAVYVQPNRYCCISSICTYSNQTDTAVSAVYVHTETKQILLYQQYMYIQQPDFAVCTVVNS